MKKKDAIYRMDMKKGQFATISRDALTNPKLSEPAFRLLMILLNNSDAWEIYTTFYQHELKWSPGKMSSAKKNLIEQGYLKESKEYTGKETIHHYTVIETPTLQPEKQISKTESQKTNIRNGSSVPDVQTLDTNKSNIDNSKLEEKKKEEINEVKCSVSVEIEDVKKESVATAAQNEQHDTTLQLKREKYFFSYGERPKEEKIIQYVVEEKGYPIEVALEIYSTLHRTDFKNKDGERINGLQGYIDLMLTEKSKESFTHQDQALQLKEFLNGLNDLHVWYVNGSIIKNPDKPLDFTTSILDMKDAAKHYFNTISRDKDEYILYLKGFLEQTNSFTPASSFCAYVKKHKERLMSEKSTDYLNRNL